MKKRKVSIEKKFGYKEISARPSVASLQATNTNHQRRSQSVKSPSVQNLQNSALTNKLVTSKNDRTMLPDEMQPPKTRFNSRDRSKETRSISSPRLKSFPAEKIKKLDNAPMFLPETNGTLVVQPDHRETGTSFANSSVKNDNGHGDAMSNQFLMNPNTKTIATTGTNQQQVIAKHQQIYQTSPHSESLLTGRITSPERQAHRPFVPNVFQGVVDYNESNPRNPSTIINQPVIIQSPPTQTAIPKMQQSLNDRHVIVDQNRDETSAFENEYERQPVGGRNIANYRQMLIQMQQQKQAAIARDANIPLNNPSSNNCQNVYHTPLHGPYQQNPQQIHQQTQHNAYYQQMSQQAPNQMQPMLNQQHQVHTNSVTCCHRNHQLPAQVPGQGMTSPQDMTMSQMRLMQHNLPIHQQNLGYPINFQAAWPQKDQWMQTISQNQQHMHQQPSPQYYYQMQDVNFNQHNSGGQDQSNLLQNQTNHKFINQQTVVQTHNLQNSGKRPLQFTPDMIRDQELLVSTMRQQGVPDEVMRRQFEALLNEQRRHLAYVMQFQQQDVNAPEVKRTQFAQKRTDRDEKPEWMIHITPPRISYSEVERMKFAQQRNTKAQCVSMDNRLPEENNKIVTIPQQNYHQQKMEEVANNQVVSPQQMYFQMNPHQQMANWTHRNNCSIPYHYAYPYGHQQNAPNNFYHQPNSTFSNYIQYPYNVPYNRPYHLHPEQQKVWLKEQNPNILNPINTAHFYEQSKKPTEPSSLLKMRVYKEVIRPQKRNNGLQDPETIQKALEMLQNPANRKGLEYLANLAKTKPTIRLDGTQNPNELPEDMQSLPPGKVSLPLQKIVSANGLENKRNPDNPPPRILRSKAIDEHTLMEYPRQKQNTRTCYSMQAEKENGTMMTSQRRDYATGVSHAQDIGSAYDQQNALVTQRYHVNNAMICPYEAVPHQHYHQMQQYNINRRNPDHNGEGDVVGMQQSAAPGASKIDRAGGDTVEKLSPEEATKRIDGVQAIHGTNVYGQPEIREARTIGGITYLARKPEYGVNTASPFRRIN